MAFIKKIFRIGVQGTWIFKTRKKVGRWLKNLILVDRALEFVDCILQNPEICILVLVIDNEKQDIEKYKKHKQISSIYTVAALDNLNSTRGLDFPFIRKCKGTQLRAENAMMRFETDYNDKKYRYYMGLAFWHTIFEENTIDTVLISGMTHGFNYDGVLLGVAEHYNASVYSSNILGIHRGTVFLFDHKRHQPIVLRNEKKIASISEYLIEGNHDVLNISFDNDENVEVSSRIKRLKNFLLKQVYRLFGYYGRATLLAIIQGTLFSERQICSSGFKMSLYDTLKCYYRILSTQRYLKKKAVKANLDEKFIYYPLHFEPEATTQTKTTLESQLVIIKMLSECLPPGWKLYVKEHPHQYRLNNDLFYYYVINGDLFKTKRYYERICSLPNVVLVCSSYSGHEMVNKSQAVASINGSVLLEAVQMETPILLFSEYHPFFHADSVLKCFSYDTCKKNMDKIYHGYHPDYSKILLLLNRYVSSGKKDLLNNVKAVINGDIE